MVVATCFQGLYGVIKYADLEYDIANNIISIYSLFISYIKKTNFKVVVATCIQRLYADYVCEQLVKMLIQWKPLYL